MTVPTPNHRLSVCLAGLSTLAWLTTTGCTTFELPAGAYVKPKPAAYQGFAGGEMLQSSAAEAAYYGVREARSRNGVVLEIADDSNPIRVLPLPPDGRPVRASDLLTQTGVLEKIGDVEATVYRYSTDSINGIPMSIKLSEEGTAVLPETDYVLKPGDRLQVKKAGTPTFDNILGAVLGM